MRQKYLLDLAGEEENHPPMKILIVVPGAEGQPAKPIGELEVDELPRSDNNVYLSREDQERLEEIVSNFRPNGFGNVRFEMIGEGFKLTGCRTLGSNGVSYMREVGK